MYALRMVLVAGMLASVLAACDRDNIVDPPAKITTVDELLARACELAADCVSASAQDIADCPADLLLQLDANDLIELNAFTALNKSKQDSILACFDTIICSRFGGSLSNISDADLMEPLNDCQ